MSLMPRRAWLAAALVPMVLYACGGRESSTPSNGRVETPSASAPAPVIPASGPTTSREIEPVTPRAVSYEDAETAFKSGDYGEARKLFKSYVEAKPDNVWGWYMLGLASWKSGSLNEAEEAFDTALAKDPKHVKSLLNSARVLMDLGRDSEALERVEAARSLDSTSAEAIRLLARAHHRLGDVALALETYRLALIGDEGDVWAMNNLGMLYIEQKDPTHALGPLSRAVQLRPTSPIFQNNLGMALELTGNLVLARRAYDDAVKADTTYTKAQANAKRLGDVVVEPGKAPTIDLKELAEAFRLQVKMWRDSVATPSKPE
ncbi:MAG TPA: tetratricopeptide repeat protein [Gemmatimonadales bacterium]|nr:tetratricopeptide repeat protein [Gemmatimonadales bacterium]